MAMEIPKVIKKGDQVITSYIDEKTGKFTAYEVGIKLEVSDFSGQWFPAKIVEVDKGEKEVLVHFENWSARFDEWIKMDSNRLRPSPNTNIVKTHFKIGENVEALWNTDGQRYPGVIQNILPNDYYQVLFDDGIKLKKKYNQIFKLKKPIKRKTGTGAAVSSRKNVGDPPIPMGPSPVLPELTTADQVDESPTGNKMNIQSSVLISKPTASVTVKQEPLSKQNLNPPELDHSQATLAPKSRKKKVVKAKAIPTSLEPSQLSEDIIAEVLPDVTPQPQTFSPESSATISEEPPSAKRKRTVKDYSALLRIRRPYQKDGEVERIKRPRRGRSSAFAEPPELFPEAIVQESSQPVIESTLPSDETVKDEVISETIQLPDVDLVVAPKSPALSPLSELKLQVDAVLSEPEASQPPLPVDIEPSVVPPTPPVARRPKPKRKFRPFNSQRRRVRKQQIKYVTVDDEEFAAAGGNLNNRKRTSATSTPNRLHSENGEPLCDGDSSAPSTPSSSREFGAELGSDILTDGTITPAVSPGDGTGPRIIKRRRRRTYARLHLAASEATGADNTFPTASSPAADEPLSKRKRTIHDYSMLLKTRPKFFFDIDAEQERPGMLSVRRRKLTDPSLTPGSGADASLLSPGPELSVETVSESHASKSMSSEPIVLETETKSIADEFSEVVDVPPFEFTKKSESGAFASVDTSENGATSIATHRPIRRSSSQFARKSHVSPDVSERRSPPPQYARVRIKKTVDFSVVLPDIHVLSTRGPETGLRGSSATVLLENIDGKIESHAIRSGNSSAGCGTRRTSLKGATGGELRRSSKLLERKSQLGSKLPDVDFNSLDDEELLDIDYSDNTILPYPGPVPLNSKPRIKSPVAPPAVVPDSSAQSSTFTSHSELPIPSAKEAARRKTRLVSNRWWKKRTPSQNLRHGITSELGASSLPVISSVPRARKILQKLKRRPGDLLSGLTLNRIRTIRNNLYKQGFRKRIIAEPSSKDVSVDIISCVCGSSDEHGLMVQCEYCQCWQHGQCFEIETVTDMPKNYVCGACLYPENVRVKKPLDYQFDFHRTGKLPRFSFGPAMQPKMTKLIQESNALIQRLYQVRGIIQTSRVHMNLMEAKLDHPKLYQWDKPHQTIRETQQERRFNKIYRPLLRRLLYFNRDDPTYVSRLRARVELVVKKRSAEERKKAEKRLNEKFPSIFPTPKPIPVPILQKRFGPPIFKTPAVPPLLASNKEAKRLEAEALRIRKELETLNKGIALPHPVATTRVIGRPLASTGFDEIKPVIPKIDPDVIVLDSDQDQEVSIVLDEILHKVEEICNETSSDNDVKPALLPEIERPTPEPAPLQVSHQISVSTKPLVVPVIVDLGEEAPPEFPDMEPLLPAITPETELNPSLAPTLQCDSTTTSGTPQSLSGVENGGSSGIDSDVPKLEGEFNDVDLMNLDPSDPTFSTIAADLVKSCCEEPESLIKTLQDLANVSTTVGAETEPVVELEGSDNDLINFLDDALMDSLPTSTNPVPIAPPIISTSDFMDSKYMLPPPPPPPPIPSTSSYVLPPAPPKLTRLTPELCRGNLILTILDQQRIIDQYLDEIETRVSEFEKMRGIDPSNRAAAFHRITHLQNKVKKMMKQFELIRSIGRKAERSLRHVVQDEPEPLLEGSDSDPEDLPVKDSEETDSADEDEGDEEFSDELEDL